MLLNWTMISQPQFSAAVVQFLSVDFTGLFSKLYTINISACIEVLTKAVFLKPTKKSQTLLL